MNRYVRLGINIDHVATLRNARGGDTPKVIEAAKVVEESGADLITVHVREDRRHINEKDLGKKIISLWPKNNIHSKPYVIFTGGEPLLQLSKKLVEFLKLLNFEIGIETNGTMDLPCKVDWVCVSPKDKDNFILKKGDELKLVYPQKKIDPKNFEKLKFNYFFLQPMDGLNLKKNIKKTHAYCSKNKKWKVSLQLHKMIGMP